MNNQVIINVPTGRRITLPKFFKVEEGESLLIQELEDNSLMIKRYNRESKIKTYGVVIGGRTENNKITAWGIFIDTNGNVLARVRSSSGNYLIQDLTLPKKREREKLDNKCGLGLWMIPELITINSDYLLPPKPFEVVRKIKKQFQDGVWPPMES